MRYKRLSPFRVMDIVAKAKEFDDTIHFEIGEPDLPPPPKVREALKKVDSKIFSYTPTLGIFELREKIANHYKRVYNIEVDVDQILITPGTSIAFMIAYELLLPAKGKLAISDPSYPCYKNFAYMVDGEVETFVTSKENNFSLNKELLESRKKEIDLIHISSPANPTGILYNNNNLKELIEFAKANNIGFISDELYHGVI
ncbi:MAG: aminotransferase class I/II-fold pyridoxal phosphate-dependent enzyme, partial [Epsilonproteobacteria bacterium]|nr:aminotransferase class I/II-fold pyridoxal phosphate-dependent enzyme [Campylobacterota bacterium]